MARARKTITLDEKIEKAQDAGTAESGREQPQIIR